MKKIYKIFLENELVQSRLICGSKSLYRERHPNNLAIFNANVVTKKLGKCWYGDLDIDVDADKLISVAKILNEDLHILYEMDCRFENENAKPDDLIKKALVVVTIDGQIIKKI